MARNGSGTYTKVNTFVAGNSITAAGHNANWDDVATEITNSVAADGQTSMTGPLKASSGTVSAPGLAFASDTNTGIYRIGSDNLGIAANGAKVVDVATTGVTVTGDLVGTTVKQGSFALIPVGLGPLPWSGIDAPAGWVLAGATYSRTTYAALWAHANTQIGLGSTFYGVGNGSTTFTIATMDGYAPVGTDASAARIASFTDVGDTAGGATQTLITANLPPYTPSGTNSGGSGNLAYSINNANWTSGSNATVTGVGSGGSNADVTIDSNQTFTGAAQGGTSTAFSIVQPSRAFSFIIFAGV